MDYIGKTALGVLGCCVGALIYLNVPNAKKKAVKEKIGRVFTTKTHLRKEWGSEVHALADYGDLTGLKAHIAKNPEDVNKWAHGEQPIHLAARYKHRQVAGFLLEKGANVNAFSHDSDRNTPLHEAFRNDDVPLIKFLLSKDANMYARNIWWGTPMEMGSVNVAKQFFNEFDFLTWFNGSLPIHDYAIYHPMLATAIVSENCGINVPCPRYNNATALHLAVAKGFQNLAYNLIEEGAQLDAQDASGNTPLHVALKKGNDPLVKLLLKNGARIDIKDHKGRTPLDLAKQYYDFNKMDRLEEAFYEQHTPWSEVDVERWGKDGNVLEELSCLMDSKTKDLYVVEDSSSKLKFKAVVISALAPLYLPISVIRQVGALALDILRVLKDIFLRIRSYSLMDALVIRPSKEMASTLGRRLRHVVVGPLCCVGLIFAGLYAQYDLNEGRKWMSRMAESWDESRLLKPFSLAKVGNLNMSIVGENGYREFYEV